MIQPCSTGCCDLVLKIEVGTVGQRQCRLWIVRAAETPDLDNAADVRCVLKDLDTTKADMMRPSVRGIDHGIGFAGQFVMQSLFHQPANDRCVS